MLFPCSGGESGTPASNQYQCLYCPEALPVSGSSPVAAAVARLRNLAGRERLRVFETRRSASPVAPRAPRTSPPAPDFVVGDNTGLRTPDPWTRWRQSG